nr:MAG TPA: hypothetical protein [Caudoviricetes sp.]
MVLTACNSIWSFILTTFTPPRLRANLHPDISIGHSYRTVHSDFRRAF